MSKVVFEPQNSDDTRPIILSPGQEVTLGDSLIADFSFPQSGIDDMHCRVAYQKFGCFIECFSAKATVEINGKSFNRGCVKNGDTVTLGNLKFRFLADSDAENWEQPPSQSENTSSTQAVLVNRQALAPVNDSAEILDAATPVDEQSDGSNLDPESTAEAAPKTQPVSLKTDPPAEPEPYLQEQESDEQKSDHTIAEKLPIAGTLNKEHPNGSVSEDAPASGFRLKESPSKERSDSTLCLNAVVWNHLFETDLFRQHEPGRPGEDNLHSIKVSMAGLEVRSLGSVDWAHIKEFGIIAASKFTDQEITETIARWAPYFKSETLFCKFIGMAPKSVCQIVFNKVKAFFLHNDGDPNVIRALSIDSRDEVVKELGLLDKA